MPSVDFEGAAEDCFQTLKMHLIMMYSYTVVRTEIYIFENAKA